MQTSIDAGIISRITGFVQAIGIPVTYKAIAPGKEFLPGITIYKGGLIIDMDHLRHPGDILHEAGHIAVAAPEKRSNMDGVLNKDEYSDGEEMMAIAWSYAAAKYLDIDPCIVFHKDGYKGDAESIVSNFAHGNFFGVSTLQWIGLTLEPKNAQQQNIPPYPHMVKWMRE